VTVVFAHSARQRAFFSAASEHPSSAVQTRAYMPREAFRSAWAVSLAQHIEPRRMDPGQVGALMLIGWFVSIALGLALLSGCEQHPKQRQPLDPERFDRAYIAFFETNVMPLAKRDGLEHASGGCETSETDLLCVECFSPGGESWVRCDDDGCASADTAADLATVGADVGVCERWQNRNGLAVSFERRAH